MTTELKRFTEAYATMTVATYEPLIIKWYSRVAVWHLADLFAKRAHKLTKKPSSQSTAGKPLTSSALIQKDIATRSGRANLSILPDTFTEHNILPEDILRLDGVLSTLGTLPDSITRQIKTRFPSFAELGGVVSPHGFVDEGGDGKKVALPILIGNTSGRLPFDPELPGIRSELTKTLLETLKKIGATEDIRKHMLDAVSHHFGNKYGMGIDFLPIGEEIHEVLSPIGIAHFYRQLYFNASEGVGPIEEAFTVAPCETLEVVYESVRRQIHEEMIEIGSESVSETATETKNLDEVSDKVSSMVQRDAAAAMSASATVSASGGVGVWSVGAGASIGTSANMSASAQRANEHIARRLKETTKRASERITKSFTVKTRDVLEVTTTNSTRRVISNTTSQPVSYGLRRVFRRVKVKVQHIGPRLVWQLYVRNPGSGLAKSKFVHFLADDNISIPSAPPATKPYPVGGTDTGSTSASLTWDAARSTYYVTVVVRTGSDRKVTAVSIDSISDLEGGGKEDLAPSAKNDVQWDQSYDTSTNTFTVKIGILEGDAASVQVSYTYVYEPGAAAINEWENERAATQATFEKAEAEARAKALQEKFEREKALITERSKIRPRPANDLRREERYEVMNRMVTHLFGRSQEGIVPEPLEIEQFHRYFDIEAMFMYMHPSWWKPRYTPVQTGLARSEYEVTAESEPAPMGSSLGWVLQLDGDTRRNELLNSPWVRVCVPIKPGRERESIAWLATHIEGEIGYDPNSNPLFDLLASIESTRQNESALGVNGPDYVTVDSTVGAPTSALKPENIYPIVDEFEVTVPTDGFVYDELKVTIP